MQTEQRRSAAHTPRKSDQTAAFASGTRGAASACSVVVLLFLLIGHAWFRGAVRTWAVWPSSCSSCRSGHTRDSAVP
eukprot:359192-Chlamydomonas_euryale.AAC.11